MKTKSPNESELNNIKDKFEQFTANYINKKNHI